LTITLGHRGEKKCCDFGGIWDQSKVDLSGRTRHKSNESQVATQQKSQLAIDVDSEIDWTLWVKSQLAIDVDSEIDWTLWVQEQEGDKGS